ncbi:GGDEF domain-containing protein [Symbiobacterium terraclitae]|uniref:GGDEF domain-containing protein n=1 Tax=Symbiobacterium terraclitae TaxID=557451 RepID=UPI0035B55D48
MERDTRLDGLRRQFLLLTLPIAAVAGFSEWLLLRRNGEPAPPLLLVAAIASLALALLLWRRRRSLRFVEAAVATGVAAALFVLLYNALFAPEDVAAGRFARLAPWVSVSLAAVLLPLGSHRATWAASGIYTGLLVIGAAYLVRTGQSGVRPALLEPLIQFYLSNAVLLCLLYSWAEMRKQYDRTRHLARSMADLAHTDPLLGIPNRRQMQAYIQREIREAEEGMEPATMIMFDVDRFKQVNDTYGHETGDLVLRAVTSAVRQTLRSTDRVGRWGGDEFIVLVHVSELSQAYQLAQRLGDAVHQKLSDRFLQVTISLGVAPYHPGDTVASWVRRADQALLGAKESGRNRVVVGS